MNKELIIIYCVTSSLIMYPFIYKLLYKMMVGHASDSEISDIVFCCFFSFFISLFGCVLLPLVIMYYPFHTLANKLIKNQIISKKTKKA